MTITSRQGWRFTIVPWIAGLINLLLNLSYRLPYIPMSRLFEANLCRTHYEKHDPSLLGPDGNVDERFCKENTIQERLAFYIGLIATLELVCELFATIPLGFASDRYGRRLVLCLNTTGPILCYAWYIAVANLHETFTLGAIVAAPFIFLITGGGNVAGSQLKALVADVTSNQRQLTKTLFYTQSTTQIVQFLAPVLTSATMTKSLWIPLAMGLSCGLSVFPLTALIPDTRPVTAQAGPLARTFSAHELIPTLTEPLLQDEADFDATAIPADAENDYILDKPSETVMASIRRGRQMLWEQLHDMRRLVTSSKNYGLCLAVFLGSTLARSSFYNLLQYASKRYHLSFAVAGYTLSINATVHFFLSILIIPRFLDVLTEHKGLPGTVANLVGLKLSLAFLLVGVLLISFSVKYWMLAFSLCVYGLGSGSDLFGLALITNLTTTTMGESHIARTYSSVAFVETIGLLIGVPLSTAVWIVGMKIGGLGLGFPWWLSAGLYLSAGVAIWQIRLLR